MVAAMVKYNPATKVSEQAKNSDGSKEEVSPESGTVSQMLENYEKTKSYRSRPETDVLEHLPDRAEFDDGTLWVPDPKKGFDYTRNRMSLTEKKRRILLKKLEYPDATMLEVSHKIGCSDTLVCRTINAFGFLLDDPYLIDAFVYEGQVPSDYFVVRNGDEEFAFPLREQAVEVGEKLWDGDSEVVSPEADVTEHEDQSDPSLSPEKLEDTVEKDGLDSPEDLLENALKEETEESEEPSVSLSVTLEEFQTIVNDVDDELQMKLLRQLYEQ